MRRTGRLHLPVQGSRVQVTVCTAVPVLGTWMCLPLLWDRLLLLVRLLCWLGSLPRRPWNRRGCFCFKNRFWTHADRIHHFCPNLQHLCCLQAFMHELMACFHVGKRGVHPHGVQGFKRFVPPCLYWQADSSSSAHQSILNDVSCCCCLPCKPWTSNT